MIAMDPDVKRTPRTLREAFPNPKDWIEGPNGEPIELAGFSTHILWLFACIGIACLLAVAYVAYSWWSM